MDAMVTSNVLIRCETLLSPLAHSTKIDGPCEAESV
ncbi:hypothetical protein Pla52o_43320 [Novipirellula galeiformis]|uniref:Uncharacterized protein n=1 Tax=Novipirellula galeiformis TaxID=2528004 RepID=A0A5C6CAN4_9BACT|nr:hypothetical protein Pla52o_43320 [Novipirellula galeiformis]